MLRTIVDLSSGEQQQRRQRRERKPRKTKICHIQREDINKEKTYNTLPELTITTRMASLDKPREDSSPLDLSTKSSHLTDDRSQQSSDNTKEPPPLIPDLSKSSVLPYSLVLKPEEYETLAMENQLYATYIFLPSVGLFVHPLAVPPEIAPASFIPLPSTVSSSNMCPPPTNTGGPNFPKIARLEAECVSTKGENKLNSSIPETNSSPDHKDNFLRISMSKFKFTGGNNPSLQERKKLSVDSEGNLNYSDSSSDTTNVLRCDKESLPENLDIVSAFESISENGGNSVVKQRNLNSTQIGKNDVLEGRSSTLITTNQTIAGDGATFLTFKNIKVSKKSLA